MGPERSVLRGSAPMKLYRPMVSEVAADSKRKECFDAELHPWISGRPCLPGTCALLPGCHLEVYRRRSEELGRNRGAEWNQVRRIGPILGLGDDFVDFFQRGGLAALSDANSNVFAERRCLQSMPSFADGVCYGTGLGELTKTCMLIECGQGVLR